jgi:4-amino-4-deoxy-L-arabinose transferase-like glycosyltransferase
MSAINATVVKAAGYGSKLTLRQSPNEKRRARLALTGILICAGLVYFWRIGAATTNPFYTVAVRSMAESWKAFFYGSFNPGNSITIDKIPGYLWPQALSARIFGFHPWSLTLPEVIEAFVTVIVTHRLVRDWAGEAAGLFAAGFLVLTPALVGSARLNNEESAFTMCLVLAAAATQRAVAGGRLRPLVLAGVWVGLAFQCKMVEAWAVLPALAAAYLLAAPPKALRRVLHVVIAGVVTAAVSIAWIVIVALVPGADRPYIDGTVNNNPFSMVFGYNALTRFGFLGITPSSVGSVTSQFAATNRTSRAGGAAGTAGRGRGGFSGFGAGATTGSGTTASSAAGASGTSGTTTRGAGGGFGGSGAYGGHRGLADGGGTASSTAATSFRGGGGGMNSQGGLLSMFERAAASQVGWLYVLALVSVVAVLWLRRREPRTDTIRAGFIMWSIWLVIYGLAYSEGEIHTYYVVTLGPALAAICGAGAMELWRAFRAGGRRAWLLPLAVAGSDVWAIYLAYGYPTYRGWLIPVLAVLGVVAIAALLTALLRPAVGRRALVLGVVASVLAVSVAPGAWAASVITSNSTGSALGGVGPTAAGGRGGFGGFGGAAGTAAGTAATGRAGRYGGGTAGGYGEYGGAAAEGGFTGGLGSGTAGGPGTAGAAGAAGAADRAGAGRTGTAGGGGGGGGFGGFGSDSMTLTTQERELLDYAEAHDGGAEFVLTVTSWSDASPYILATGADVLSMGGFTGAAPFPTLGEFQQYVKLGEVRFVQLPAATTGATGFGGFGGFGNTSSNTAVSAVESWVRDSCSTVAASAYGGSTTTSTTTGATGLGAGAGGAGGGTLYACTKS